MAPRLRPPQAVLPEPGEPAADLPPWGPVRLARAVGARWRRWMAVPVVLLLVAAAVLAPVDATVDHPGTVVDAAELLAVEVAADARIAAGGFTGAYLLPRAEVVGSALGLAGAALGPGRVRGPGPTALLPPGVPTMDVALLAGAGVAPGRGEPAALGLSVRLREPDVPVDRLGLLLHVADQVSPQDLARGRRILVLGALAADGTVRCAGDVSVAVAAATPPVDLVVTGPGCGGDAPVPVVEVATFADALVAVAAP